MPTDLVARARAFLRPKSCAADGHDWRPLTRRGYTKGCGFRCVAHSVEQGARRCRRCKEQEPWAEIDHDCIHSLSMPPSMWATMKREGFVDAD